MIICGDKLDDFLKYALGVWELNPESIPLVALGFVNGWYYHEQIIEKQREEESQLIQKEHDEMIKSGIIKGE